MSEPKVIYLGPACEADTGDGRTWAEDNPWPDCECGHRPVQYVLGETFNRVVAEREALQLRLNAADQRIDEQRVALMRIRDRADAFAEDERDMQVASVEVIRDIAARALGEVDQSSPDQFRDVVNMIAERTPNPDFSLIGIVHTPPMECEEP